MLERSLWGVMFLSTPYSILGAQDEKCPMNWDPGTCRGFEGVWTYDADSDQCVSKIYGGCGGNENRFQSQTECSNACLKSNSRGSKSDVCELPPTLSKKACFGYFPRYSFSSATGKCEKIIYGGCGGSGNLFSTLAECQNVCEDSKDDLALVVGRISLGAPLSSSSIGSQDSEDICTLPPIHTGRLSCFGFMPKWTFNASMGCVPYVYGGCGGTANLFDKEEDCKQKCDPATKIKTAEVCSLPISPGPCKRFSLSPNFGFNPATSRCEAFNYGGCRGNENRFSTVEECTKVCGGVEPQLNPTL